MGLARPSPPELALEGPTPALQAHLHRWLELGVGALAAVVLGCWLLIASVHVDDTYALDHTAGAWLALARYAGDGVLYPPLYDGSSFGGTRFMPLQFVTHAGLARSTGDYLISGKLLAYASAVALFALTFVLARRLSGSLAVASGAVAAVVVTPTGLLAATSVRGDALPVALQLGGVMLATRGSRRATAGAAFLCALAMLSKSSALWAPLAIGLWLAVRDRRRLLLFSICFATMLASALVAFEVLSSGRMSDNILGLSSSGLGGAASIPFDGTHRFVDYGQRYAAAVWVLIPLSLAGLVTALGRRRPAIYHVAFLIALPLAVVELADVGASWNHLIDVEVLTTLLVAELYGATRDRSRPLMAIVVLVALVWGIGTSFQLKERKDAADAVRAVLGSGPSYDRRPLAKELGPEDVLLSEDPYVAVSLDHDPVVLDPFMLLRLVRDHPDWQAGLLRRVETRHFTKIVLTRRLDPSDRWWREYHFGVPLVTAISRNYRLHRHVGRYWLYQPIDARPALARANRGS